MYGWIWRKLPGGWPIKTLESIVMVGAVAMFLVAVVFPWVEPKLPFSGNTVSGETEDVTPSETAVPTTTTKAPKPTDVPSPAATTPGDDVIPGE